TRGAITHTQRRRRARDPIKTDFSSGRLRRHAAINTLRSTILAPDRPALSLPDRWEGILIRFRIALAGLLLTLVLIGGAAYPLSSAQPAKQSAPASAGLPPVPVVADAVKSGDVPIFLRGIGTVQAYNTDTIRTQVQGQITQVAFK